MAIVIYEDFNDGSAAVAARWNGTVSLEKTGCTGLVSGYLLACGGTAAFAGGSARYRTFANSATAAIRCPMAVQNAVANHASEPFWLRIPGQDGSGNPTVQIAAVGFEDDGTVYIRSNPVFGFPTSAPGAYPNDGTPFALQFGVSLVSGGAGIWSMDVTAAIDNVQVLSANIVLSPIAGGAVPFGYMNAVAIAAPTNLGVPLCTALDNLEIDNSAAQISYGVCADMLHVGQGDGPTAVVTGMSLDCDAATFTLTGTGFRSAYLTTVQIFGTEGQLLDTTIVSMTATEIVVTTTDPTPDGPYCANVFNDPLCFEYAP